MTVYYRLWREGVVFAAVPSNLCWTINFELFESIVLPMALSARLAHYPASLCMSCLTSSKQSPRIRKSEKKVI